MDIMGKWDREIREAAFILSKAAKASAFCGAGVSAESGIATFRDPGGIWDRVSPDEVGTASGLIRTLEQKADILKPVFIDMIDSFEQAELNPGHKALVDLEKMGIMKTIITQNVDDLHSEAGSENVIEVHGSLFRMVCLSCGSRKKFERKPFLMELREKLNFLESFSLENLVSLAPECPECNSMMRPDVVMFGEAVQHLPQAFNASKESDVMLILGTSGVVYPAAYFPVEARKAGAEIILINPTENPFSDITDVYIPMKFGDALPAVVDRIKEMAV